MTIAGVIVTYNRKELLVNNIEMQIKQNRKVDRLYIIDNHSTDESENYVKERFGDNSWIEYIYLSENTGGAGGFSFGVEKAYEEGFDLVWLMDDDGRPLNENTLQELEKVAVKLYSKNKKLFINSLVTVEGKSLSFGFAMKENLEDQLKKIYLMKNPNNFLENHANPFNGTLISKETIKEVGLPNKLFFCARDETDYLRRCQDRAVLIGTVTTSLYHHPCGVSKGLKIGKIYIPYMENIDKQYYWIRNLTYSYKDSHQLRMICYDFIFLLSILLFQDKKTVRLKVWYLAIKDAFNNRMGKKKES